MCPLSTKLETQLQQSYKCFLEDAGTFLVFLVNFVHIVIAFRLGDVAEGCTEGYVANVQYLTAWVCFSNGWLAWKTERVEGIAVALKARPQSMT